MSAALHALLQRSCQLADLDAIVARANERLAELRTRKPYPVRAAAVQVERRERAVMARNAVMREVG